MKHTQWLKGGRAITAEMRVVETVPPPARGGRQTWEDGFTRAKIHPPEVGPPQCWMAGGGVLAEMVLLVKGNEKVVKSISFP